MEIDEALAYLDDRINLEALAVRARSGRAQPPTLDRMRAIVAALGDPQHDAPIVHLTGTNGKGSTARILTALLLAAGLTTGTYTSPHLQRVNERIRRNDLPIADHELADALAAVALAETATGVRPTWFEVLTAAAYRHFSDEAVEAAVVEVGMAGRWDATNVGDGSVAVITNIGLDHLEYLGPDRRSIASEKVGIVKPGATLVLGETDPELADVFDGAGAARTWRLGAEFGCDRHRLAVGGRVVTLRTPTRTYADVVLPLHGAHQQRNAALALAAAEAFLGAPLEAEVVEEAFANVRLPGRFEIVDRQPLVVLDGAHNPDGARALVATLDEEFSAVDRRVLVLGLLARDPAELAAAFDIGPDRDRLVVCCAPDSPRAVPSHELADTVRERGVQAVVVDDVAAAIDRAVRSSRPADAVVVTGSLYLVGAARTALGLDVGTSTSAPGGAANVPDPWTAPS